MLSHSQYLVVEEGQNSYNNISHQKVEEFPAYSSHHSPRFLNYCWINVNCSSPECIISLPSAPLTLPGISPWSIVLHSSEGSFLFSHFGHLLKRAWEHMCFSVGTRGPFASQIHLWFFKSRGQRCANMVLSNICVSNTALYTFDSTCTKIHSWTSLGYFGPLELLWDYALRFSGNPFLTVEGIY